MKYDGPINLATGMSAKSKTWKNEAYTWSKLVDRLSQEHKTTETFKEFIAATKVEQGKIKDVGGYVGGYLRNGRRKPENVVNRQVLTLDIDFAHMGFWEDFQMLFDNAAVLHATHKHCETSPRFRLLMPLSREASPDEYVATARQIAGTMGIDLFDNTTFETNRLMFWPSSPTDVDYYFEKQDGPWIDVDEILATYKDWKDSSLWPTADREFQKVKTAADKQQDPETKRGVIGYFCRTYTITEVIEKFLADVYIAAGEGRYTYTKGSAAAGLILYDDKFAYSHHGTDPTGGKLCNAYDLVRIHKYGHLDTDQKPGAKPKSVIAMEDFIQADEEVKRIIASEKLEGAKYDFQDEYDPEPEAMEEDNSWMKELEVDGKAKYLSSATNINLILKNDIRLKGLFKQNDFDGKRYVFGTMPWRRIIKPEPAKNVDYSGVRNYIETIYGITGSLKIDDSLAVEFEKNRFHPVREYLDGLKWDKVERVDTLLIDYFGVEDKTYTREAMRKMLVGAVARIYRPGIKFDLVLTLVGKTQGSGKSSFFRALGRDWFSDSFSGVNGKEAYEQLQGSWILEMAELKGLRKSDIESVKHFISKQEDSFRPAYARVVETFLRQCVFVATTNEMEFLRDPSGNRRFMPVDVHGVKLTNNPGLMEFIQSPEVIAQVWAEAVELYRKGETLYLSPEAEATAEDEQRKHSEADERRGLIEAYLDRLIPKGWDELNLYERRDALNDPLAAKDKETYPRRYVCVAEIWCECLSRDKKDMDRYKTREINEILRGLEGWTQSKSTRNFPIYGKQKYYEREEDSLQ